MDFIEGLKLRIRRGETPVYRALRASARWFLSGGTAPVPRFLRPLCRALYELHFFVIIVARRLLILGYKEPLFRSRCATAGRRLTLSALPYVHGHTEIHVGDDVTITGDLSIISGRFIDRPKLVIGDRALIGGGTLISVNQEVIIEEDVIISPGCRISDNDGHPRDAELRAQSAPLSRRDIRPVRIQRRAWVGSGSQVMKGVTIGEGAIVGANSVVIGNVPPHTLVMGNPAEVYFRNIGRSRARTSGAP